MGMGEELMGEFAFERNYPFGLPNVCCPVWKTKTGECIAVSQMDVLHILNCMKLVGEDDPWFGVFAQEIIKRQNKGGYSTSKLINAELLLEAHKALHGDAVKKPELERLKETIALQPEASEEDVIITCADCRYAAPLPHWMAKICVEGTMMCNKCRGRREYGASCVQPNDYCSDAEEKE